MKQTKQPNPKAKTPELIKPHSYLRAQRVFLLSFAIGLYGLTIGFDYTLDDTLMITGNSFTQKGFDGIGDIFTNDAFTGFFGEGSGMVAGGRYRPFTHFMFAVETALFGFNPAIGHALNVFFYALLLLVLFAFLRRLFPEEKSAKPVFFSMPFVITALFAAHPLHTEVVANIKGRDEIITMLCSLGAMLLLFDYIKDRKPWRLLASGALFFIALLSKENAVTWLAVFPLALYFYTKATRKDYIIGMSVLVLPTLVFLYIRSQVVGGVLDTEITPELLNNPFIHSSKGEEIATVIFTWLMYAKLIVFPYPLTHDYYPKQIAITNFSDPLVWLTLLVVIISIVAIFRGLRNKSIWAFGLVVFWATFSIASNLLFNIGTFMNERFMFVPILGFCIIGGYFFNKYREKWPTMKTVLIILLAFYSIRTVGRSFAWTDNYTLFLTDVETSTNSAKVNVSAAEMLLQRADEERNQVKKQKLASDALRYLNRAREIHPDYYGVYDLSGKAWFTVGNYKNAMENYMICMRLDPERRGMESNIYATGIALLNQKDYRNAITVFNHLSKSNKDSAVYRFQLSIAYDNLGLTDSAIWAIQESILTDSTYAPAWNKAGELYGKGKNDFLKAEKYLLKAYQLNPKDASTLENLGVLYGYKGRFRESVFYLKRAHGLAPNNKQIMRNLSSSYQAIGKADSAEYFRFLSSDK